MRHAEKYGRFRLEPAYPHKRSDGLTHRTNGGTRFQVRPKEEEMKRIGDAWVQVNVALGLLAAGAWGIFFAKCWL